LIHIYSIPVARHALTLRSKGQSHTVTKTVTVARLLVPRAATVVAGVSAGRYNCLFSSYATASSYSHKRQEHSNNLRNNFKPIINNATGSMNICSNEYFAK